MISSFSEQKDLAKSFVLDFMSQELDTEPLEIFHYQKAIIRTNYKLWHETSREFYHDYMHYHNRATGMLQKGYFDRTYSVIKNGHAATGLTTIAYDAIARACGYPRVHACDNLETFSILVERILAEPGPVFTWLKVRPEVENQPIGARAKWRTRTAGQAILDLRRELGIAEQ